MIVGPPVRKEAIQFHYDLLSVLYCLLWGPHLHHGLWDGAPTGTMLAAQERLLRLLAERAGVGPGERVVDVGCGLGGSSLELARLGCHVLGVTLSPVQHAWAAASARLRGLAGRARFRCVDAERLRLPPESADVVWNVECSEHLHDKAAFFRKAGGWLRPGGRAAVCAWLAGDGPAAAEGARKVCEGFLCPSLGTADDYRGWLTGAGLEPVASLDLTDRVAASWEVGLRRVAPIRNSPLARLFGREAVRFADSFQVLLDGYRSGAMRYGLFVGRKPA